MTSWQKSEIYSSTRHLDKISSRAYTYLHRRPYTIQAQQFMQNLARCSLGRNQNLHLLFSTHPRAIFNFKTHRKSIRPQFIQNYQQNPRGNAIFPGSCRNSVPIKIIIFRREKFSTPRDSRKKKKKKPWRRASDLELSSLSGGYVQRLAS